MNKTFIVGAVLVAVLATGSGVYAAVIRKPTVAQYRAAHKKCIKYDSGANEPGKKYENCMIKNGIPSKYLYKIR